MGLKTGEDPPPKSTDLEGWRRAVEDGRFRGFRMEEIVAAIQDLGPGTDKQVLNPIAKHLSDVLLRILRKCVDTGYANQGRDIIERVHGHVIDAVLAPNSADGQGLRTAFTPRVEYRIKDGLSKEKRAARNLREPVEWGRASSPLGESELPPLDGATSERCYNPSSEIAENMDVESVLRWVTDDQKRLAFRLHMDGVPYKSDKTPSIASTLGMSEKTAREWIEEVKAHLSNNRQPRDLIETKRISAPRLNRMIVRRRETKCFSPSTRPASVPRRQRSSTGRIATRSSPTTSAHTPPSPEIGRRGMTPRRQSRMRRCFPVGTAEC